MLEEREVMGVSSNRRLLASMFCRTILCRTSGICCHCPSLAALRSLGCIAGFVEEEDDEGKGRVPGILALGERSEVEERKGIPPASTASLSHCSHSSSITVAALPASLCATAARNLSFNSSPTLWISISESSSISSSSSCSLSSCISSILSRSARIACAPTTRSSGGTQSGISSPVVSRILQPCSFSKRSFAHLVPSHFVNPAISLSVSRRLSKARNKRLCQGYRERRLRCGL